MRRAAFVAVLVMALAVTASGQTSQTPKKFLGGPLTIEDQGSFFVGGVQKVTDYAVVPGPPPPGAAAPTTPPPVTPQQITIGQMYVQFQIPAKKYGGGWPVIMVHGSTHTGACLEATPDGREGWYPYFVRNGVPSYVVDQAGRGRSGFDQSVLHEGEARLARGDAQGAAALIPSFGRITDNGAWTAWFGHLVPANSTVLTGTLIPHGAANDPNPTPDSYKHVAPLFPIETVDQNLVSRTGAIGPAPGAHRRTTRSSTTSSWCRTPRSRCRARRARPAIPRSSPPPTPGRRRTWPRSSSGSVARSW